MIPRAVGEPFTLTMLSGAKQAASDLRMEVKVLSPKSAEPAAQLSLIKQLLADGGAGYLLVDPADKTALIPLLTQAHERGMRIITVNSFIGDGDYTNGPVTFPLSHIGTDDLQAGSSACKTLAKVLGHGALIHIESGRAGLGATELRLAGCQEAARAAGLRVVATSYNEGGVDSARQHVADTLARNPNLQGVLALDAASADGADLALRQAGQGRAKLMAFDATTSTLRLLREGRAVQVVAEKPFDMGYLAVSMAVAHANGFESLPRQIPTLHVAIGAGDLGNIDMGTVRYDAERPVKPPLRDFTVAFVPGARFPFYATMYPGVRRAAELYGIELIRQVPASFDVSVQVPIIKKVLAENRVNYLIVSPTDKDKLTPLLENIQRSGIPVITVDTFIGTGDYVNGPVTFPLTYIGSDNVAGGYVACSQLALAAMGGKGGKIYIQNSRKGISSTDDRATGCRKAAERFGMEVIGEGLAYQKGQPLDTYLQNARAQTAALLTRNNDLVGVFGTVNFLAQGSGEAIVAAGLRGVVEVAAFDADRHTVTQLEKGVVTQIVTQKPGDMGYFGVLTAVAHARGVQSIPKRWSTGFAVMNKGNADKPEVARYVYVNEESEQGAQVRGRP